MTDAVGYVASALAMLMWLPQVLRTFRQRRDPAALSGISLPMYVTAVVFNALLLAYGIGSDAAPVAAAGAVNLCCGAAIVALATTGRSSRA